MGKINKFANIYDKDGNLIRHVGDDGKLKKYTTEELEELVDKLSEDKDENGAVKYPQSLNNVSAMLFQYYQKYGNPHEKELIQKLQDYQKAKSEGSTMAQKTDEETIKKALSEDINEPINTVSQSEELVDRETNYEPETYVDFEEITDSDESSKEVKDVA